MSENKLDFGCIAQTNFLVLLGRNLILYKFFQFADYVSDRSSTHGGRWYSSVSSCPWIKAVLFLFFFTIQILLFVIFVEKIFFNEKVDIKTSLEYVNNWDYHYPQITLCNSVMYNKTVLKRKFLIQLRWEKYFFG